jgi:uncharacterized membrane protein YfhO
MTKVALTVSAILIFLYCFVVGTSNYFGSEIDWVSQHTVFPDYFRNLFYHNHNLFPDFAPHIGNGQNIYFFSYYGLFNPWLTLSYLFPFISMVTYIQVINFLIIVLDGILFYHWTSTKYPKTTSYVGTILFVLSTPIIFHAHRHFMFTDYMPFLLMSFIGIDLYFARKQQSFIILSTFLAITTSYYFTPGVLLAQLLYFIFKAINAKMSGKVTLQQSFRLIGHWSVSVLMSMALLLPTLYVIVHSGSPGETVGLAKLLTPVCRVNTLMYDSYSLGYGFISVLALFFCFTVPKSEVKALSAAILVAISIPLFSYILNGTLYVRDKAFIPLSPLIGLLILELLDAFCERRASAAQLILAAFLSTVWAVLGGVRFSTIFLLELIFVAATMWLYYVTRKNLLFGALVAIALIHMVKLNRNEVYVNRDTYARNSAVPYIPKDLDYRSNLLNDTRDTVNRVFDDNYKQTSVYSSLKNVGYSAFYKSIFNNVPFRNEFICAQTSNVMLQSLLGVKHVITGAPSAIYAREKSLVYTNHYALPIGYASSQLLSQAHFAQLDQFEQLEALLNHIVVKDETDGVFHSAMRPYEFKFPGIGTERFAGGKGQYFIDVQRETTFKLPSSEFKGIILLLRFDITNEQSCSVGDLSIAIEGSVNTKTCKEWMYKNENNTFHYVLNTDRDVVNMTVARGHYVIENVEARLLNNDEMVRMKYDPFVIAKYENNVIEGSVDVSHDGYFALSIPYDRGFTVKVDGRATDYSRVNEWFIGFKIYKGKHEIHIEFNAPFKKAGIGLSVLGFLLFCSAVIADKRAQRFWTQVPPDPESPPMDQ